LGADGLFSVWTLSLKTHKRTATKAKEERAKQRKTVWFFNLNKQHEDQKKEEDKTIPVPK
jgi:hypothetical protein